MYFVALLIFVQYQSFIQGSEISINFRCYNEEGKQKIVADQNIKLKKPYVVSLKTHFKNTITSPIYLSKDPKYELDKKCFFLLQGNKRIVDDKEMEDKLSECDEKNAPYSTMHYGFVIKVSNENYEKAVQKNHKRIAEIMNNIIAYPQAKKIKLANSKQKLAKLAKKKILGDCDAAI